MKNKAFTILEALISLMLISIIIGLTFTIINLIGRQLSLFNQENTQVVEYNLFNSTLLMDIDRAASMDFNNDRLILETYDESIIEYKIEKPNLLRQIETKTDTFKIGLISHDFMAEKNADRHLKKLLLKMAFLKDTIAANYYLDLPNSEAINQKFFDED